MVSARETDEILMRGPAFARVALLFALPVALIAGAVFATGQVERHAALLGASRTAASQELLTAMLDQETGARGFFETRDPVFLQPWTRGSHAAVASLAQLRSLVRGDSVLTRMVAVQNQRATAWHSVAAAAIATLRGGGHSEALVAALRSKGRMDSFRAANAAFQARVDSQSRSDLARASVIAVAVAASLALVLVWLGLMLTRRSKRLEAIRQHDQSELRELLQVSESEQESRKLLIRHIEKILPGALAAVFNRNNSDDRLEATLSESGVEVAADSPLSPINAERLRPRSCMAVRLSRGYYQGPDDHPLVSCEICGGMRETSVCQPLLVGGQVIGSVLVVTDNPIDGYRRGRISESIVQATPILANQRNLNLAETRAASDALTGLPNRRSADATLKRMAAHAGRAISPLAAILLDLDHFKVINDRYGHESGDKVLALVGRILNSTIRGSDFAARFGGEEFLILLPDTDREGAVTVAEKIRSEIARSEVPGIGGPLAASLGVAILPGDASESDELLRKADRALYTAKESGRNRVHAFTSKSSTMQTRPAPASAPEDADQAEPQDDR
jgi:diguanylate cyclase (GGDEF)-like protein